MLHDLSFTLPPSARLLPFHLILSAALASTSAHAGLLQGSDTVQGDFFGLDFALSGTAVIVSAVSDDIGSNPSQGSAYFFNDLLSARGTVTEKAKLLASDGAANDGFGSSVALSGTTAIVGASGDDILTQTDAGSAYVFRNLPGSGLSDIVTQDLKLIAYGGMSSDRFGSSVAIGGKIAVVGASNYNVGQGSAYVFRNIHTASGTITQNTQLFSNDGAAGDYFGFSAALSGSTVVVGALYAVSSASRYAPNEGWGFGSQNGA